MILFVSTLLKTLLKYYKNIKNCNQSHYIVHTIVKLIETGSDDWFNRLLTIVDNKKMV